MLKLNRFLILVLVMMVQLAHGRSYLKSHEDFVTLPESEQDRIIIQTMELAVELEARYEKDLETYGFNQERFENYQKALRMISGLFIDSAYAAESGKMDWGTLGQDFINLLKRPDSRCIFAGWVSTPSKDKSGKTTCAHPGNKSQDATPEGKAYPAPAANSGCKKGDPKKIQCNPVLFGYKKESDKSLFCVDATNGAHNSSYNCMKEALNVGSSQKGDPKETRLKNLRDRLAKNPEIYKGVQEFTYKTCVCEETDKNVNFNKDYHQYMRPHRTCYGLMEMMAETSLCEDPKLAMDVSIFKSLRNFTKNKITSQAEADQLYSNFINTEVKTAAPKQFARLCGGASEATPVALGTGDPTPAMQTVHVTGKKEYTCSVTCTPSQEKDVPFKCDYFAKNGKDEDVPWKTQPKELPESKDTKSLTIKNSIKGKDVELTCPLTFKKEEEKKPDDGPKPTLKISIKEETATDIKLTAEPTDKGEWKIVWKTHAVKKKTTKKEEKSISKAIAQTTNTDEEDKENSDKDKDSDKEKDGKKKDDAPEDSGVTEGDIDALEISRSRDDETYKVCAELRKGDEIIAAAPDCLEVKAKDKAAAEAAKPTAPKVNPMGGGMPGQQPQMRRTPLNQYQFGVQ